MYSNKTTNGAWLDKRKLYREMFGEEPPETAPPPQPEKPLLPRLDMLTHSLLIKMLRKYGNSPDEDQRHALVRLCHAYYEMAIGRLNGWYAIYSPRR